MANDQHEEFSKLVLSCLLKFPELYKVFRLEHLVNPFILAWTHTAGYICSYVQKYSHTMSKSVFLTALKTDKATTEKTLYCSKQYDELIDMIITINDFDYYLIELKRCCDNNYLKTVILKSADLIVNNKPESCIEALKTAVFELNKSSDASIVLDVPKHTERAQQKYSEVKKNPDIGWGIRTGFSKYDMNTLGLHPGQFILVLGSTNSGKSITTTVIASNIYRLNKKVLYFSVEMSYKACMNRFISCLVNINLDKYKTGLLVGDEEVALNSYHTKRDEITKNGGSLIVVDDPICTPLKIEMFLGKEIARGRKPDLIVVDYLGIMSSDKTFDAKHEEQGDIAKELRLIARKYQVPLITPVQTNRDKTARDLNRVAKSVEIVNTADVVLMIKDPEKDEDPSKIQYAIIKNRDGKLDSWVMNKNFSNMQIFDMPLTTGITPL